MNATLRLVLCVVVLCAVVSLTPVIAQAAVAEPQEVLAAWSQIIGQTSAGAAGALAPPQVEMRFVVHSDADCGDFAVSVQSAAGGGWTRISGKAPAKRTNTYMPLKGINICSFAFTGSYAGNWYAARLEQEDRSGQWVTAVLTSEIVCGNTTTVGPCNPPKGGKSDGEKVIVAGPLSIGKRHPSNGQADLVMVTIGDTGCRGFPGGTTTGRQAQNCDTAYQFPDLADRAARQKPDLVVHVGDYRYFLEGQIHTDSWLYWQRDFFPAAQPLLLAAPWVFSRGNHEMCYNLNGWGFGEAYFQLFGTPANDNCVKAMEPWYFDVAPGGIGSGQHSHRLVMIDNSDDQAAHLQINYETAIDITRATHAPASAWWVSHIPPLNLIFYLDRNPSHCNPTVNNGDYDEHTGDSCVRSALLNAEASKNVALCARGACQPSTYLLGHQHLFQRLVFPNDSGGWAYPEHYIVGHGGVKSDNASPSPPPYSNCSFPGFEIDQNTTDATGTVTTEALNGFVTWTRNASTVGLASGWKPEHFWGPGTPRPPNPGTPAVCMP